MNRRDFLKTLCLALSALVLPKARAEPPVAPAGTRKPSGHGGVMEIFDGAEWVEIQGASLKTHQLTDYVLVSDELLADDVLCSARALFYEGVAPPTLMGYPIVFREDCPDNTVFLISGDYRPQVLKNIVPPEEV